MSVKSIILKLLAAAAFIVGIGGGMYGVVVGLDGRDWTTFLQASALFLVGVMVVAAIVPWIAYFDGQSDQNDDKSRVTVGGSAFAALMAMYVSANMLFVLAGVFLAVEDGRWDICGGAIASLVVMIFVSILMSLFWQISKSTKVKRDPDAVEAHGVVMYKCYDFHILVFRHMYLITELTIDIDGVKSTARLRAHSKLGKLVRRGNSVTVLVNMKHHKYCYLKSVDEESATRLNEVADAN